MKDAYFNYYLLSYFHLENEITPSQIFHVLRGKKTPAMYYLTETKQWHHGFALEKQIDQNYILKIVQAAVNKKWLVSREDGYLLTVSGTETLKNYFKKHYYPKAIYNFMTLDLHQPFWELLQLFTQVFSEQSYQNKHYTPVIKNPRQQEKVRQLLEAKQGQVDQLLKQWIQEQHFLFEHLQTKQATSLANLLTGHELVGKTRKQIAQQLKCGAYEFNFYLRDILETIFIIIQKHSAQMVLLSALFEQTKQEYFLSMGESTYRTFQMLQTGLDLQTIAQKRRLKLNTIKEHLLEIAYVLRDFPTQKFVPAPIYQGLKQKWQQKEEYTYQEASADFKNLEFYHFRLVELERMRRT